MIIKMNMDQWTKELLEAPVKKALPVLSFPSIQLMGITVKELINDSDLQAKGMKAVADRTPNSGGAVSLMDLSVEAECFGAPIRVADDEVPTVVGPVLDTEIDEDERMEAAEALEVPEIGAGRTQIYIDAIGKAMDLITDRPVFAGVIGPFSLAGRLMDVTSSLIYCYDEPEMSRIWHMSYWKSPPSLSSSTSRHTRQSAQTAWLSQSRSQVCCPRRWLLNSPAITASTL